jgi:hypothetical protein
MTPIAAKLIAEAPFGQAVTIQNSVTAPRLPARLRTAAAGNSAKRACGGSGLNYGRSRLMPMARNAEKSRLGRRLILERCPATASGV